VSHLELLAQLIGMDQMHETLSEYLLELNLGMQISLLMFSSLPAFLVSSLFSSRLPLLPSLFSLFLFLFSDTLAVRKIPVTSDDTRPLSHAEEEANPPRPKNYRHLTSAVLLEGQMIVFGRRRERRQRC
jgi:hypothetical protein